MRLTITQIALLALPALIHANPVALIDFVPRVSDVSSGCSKVYNQKIPDCDSKDFTQQECSASCVRGLESMTKDIEDACGNEGLLDRGGDPNVLAVFLQGRGPANLCANADEVLSSKASSSTAATTSSEEPTSTASPTAQSTTSAESTTVASSTATASSGDVPTSLVMDTSASPGATTSATSTESEASASATGTESSSQIFQAPSMPPTFASASPSSEPTEHSGGGSPFDAADAQFSAGAVTSLSAWMLVFASAFAGFAAQW